VALVIIQLGHCYRTSGATGTSGVDSDPTEQEFATAAGKAATKRLQAAGHQVRTILADAPDSHYRGGNLFVAVHCDGSEHASARGASVGYRNDLGQQAAGLWKAAYHTAGWSGGWRPDNYTKALAGYYGVKRAVEQGTTRAFIVECGFLTSPADERLLWPDGPDRFAIALTAAAVDLFGGQAPPEEDDLLGALTDEEQRELLRKVRQIWDETAANPDDQSECRLKDVTIRVRELSDDTSGG
jgi:N-acetylmuramoyl-L-alanine amidase